MWYLKPICKTFAAAVGIFSASAVDAGFFGMGVACIAAYNASDYIYDYVLSRRYFVKATLARLNEEEQKETIERFLNSAIGPNVLNAFSVDEKEAMRNTMLARLRGIINHVEKSDTSFCENLEIPFKKALDSDLPDQTKERITKLFVHSVMPQYSETILRKTRQVVEAEYCLPNDEPIEPISSSSSTSSQLPSPQ